jgi:hypothetical protein
MTVDFVPHLDAGGRSKWRTGVPMPLVGHAAIP